MLRKSRVFVITEVDLGLNRFWYDRRYKSYHDGSILYIAIKTPFENSMQQYVQKKILIEFLGSRPLFGWASDVVANHWPRYFLWRCVCCCLPHYWKSKMSAAQSISWPRADPKTKAKLEARICKHNWSYILTHLINNFKINFIIFKY